MINKDLEDLQIAKTLIHEYAHSILHKQTDKNQSQREIEAESLAFVLCDHFGLDTSEYSFGYIASYADKDFDELKALVARQNILDYDGDKYIDPDLKEELEIKARLQNKNYTSPSLEK